MSNKIKSNGTYPLIIRDVAPGEGFTRLTGERWDGLPDGFHSGGAWLSPDGTEVWKPLDGRPWANADYHVPTMELDILTELSEADVPGFPRNFHHELRNERHFLVRKKALVAGRDFPLQKLALHHFLTIEQGVRDLNARHWSLNDAVSVAMDQVLRVPFILDLSNVGPQTHPPADDEWRLLAFAEAAGLDRLVKLRRAAHRVLPLLWKQRDDWPGPEWKYVYASRNRPISAIWAEIPDAHYVPSPYAQTEVWTWVVTPKPLIEDLLVRYELVYGWSPIPYQLL